MRDFKFNLLKDFCSNKVFSNAFGIDLRNVQNCRKSELFSTLCDGVELSCKNIVDVKFKFSTDKTIANCLCQKGKRLKWGNLTS